MAASPAIDSPRRNGFVPAPFAHPFGQLSPIRTQRALDSGTHKQANSPGAEKTGQFIEVFSYAIQLISNSLT
jgi:hypothetical protein